MTEAENNEKGSLIDSLDLARGEVNDEDIAALEIAINNLDFATRRASEDRVQKLEQLSNRLVDLVDQISRGERRALAEREPLSPADLEKFGELVDEGVSAGERGDLDTAVARLEAAVALNPDDVNGLFNLGVVYGLLAHKNIARAEFYDNYVKDEVFVEKAQICYDHILEEDPNHLPSLNNLATLYSMRAHRDDAVALLKRIVGIEPEDDTEKKIVQDAGDQLRELENI